MKLVQRNGMSNKTFSKFKEYSNILTCTWHQTKEKSSLKVQLFFLVDIQGMRGCPCISLMSSWNYLKTDSQIQIYCNKWQRFFYLLQESSEALFKVTNRTNCFAMIQPNSCMTWPNYLFSLYMQSNNRICGC